MKKLLALTLLAASLAGAQSKKILAPDLSQEWIDKIHAAVPGATIVKDGSIADADALIGSITPEELSNAHKLKWVQVLSAGVDHMMFPELVHSDVTVTNMKVIYGPEIADHAFAFLLALTRKLNVTIPAQVNEEWKADRTGMTELNGKTAVIIGVGGIGRQIAQRAFGFGMKVIGVDVRDYPPDVLVSRYVKPDQLDEVIPLADVVFISVPLTKKSEGMMGSKEFELMKKGSYFIAVSRGKIYSMNGLVKALDEHRLAGLQRLAQERGQRKTGLRFPMCQEAGALELEAEAFAQGGARQAVDRPGGILAIQDESIREQALDRPGIDVGLVGDLAAFAQTAPVSHQEM